MHKLWIYRFNLFHKDDKKTFWLFFFIPEFKAKKSPDFSGLVVLIVVVIPVDFSREIHDYS